MRVPFSAPPTLAEFLRRLREFGVECKTSPPIQGPRGSISFRYVSRGRHSDYPLPTYLKDDDRVTPDVIRSVCRAMGLPPGIFELGLEDFGIDEDEAY